MTGNGRQMTLGTSNLRYLYWTPFQQLTHHASALCGLNTGDLIGTGTISGDVRFPSSPTPFLKHGFSSAQTCGWLMPVYTGS